MKTYLALEQAAKRRLMHRPVARRQALRGFTLTELMIAVGVVAILAAVAIPSYSAYVVRGKRAEAKTALMQAAQFMERIYSQSGCYGFTDAASCAAGAGAAVTVPTTAGASDYAVAFSAAPSTLNNQGYTLAATPCGSTGANCTTGSTFTDPACGTLTLDNAGAKGALGVSPLTTATATGATLAAIGQCWDR